MYTPASLEAVTGQVVRSWLRSDWAQVRAVLVMVSLVGFGGRGLVSEMRRLPRSKVCGIWGLIMTELDGLNQTHVRSIEGGIGSGELTFCLRLVECSYSVSPSTLWGLNRP